VRLVLEGGGELDLGLVFERARELYGAALPAAGADEARNALADFLHDRLEFLLGRQGLAYDEIAAARGAAPRSLDFRALAARARAVHDARSRSEFLAVALAAKRIANILKGVAPGEVEAQALAQEAERDLHAAGERFRGRVDAALASGDFAAGLAAVEALAAPLDRFFVDILVMDPDPAIRRNRLALLDGLRRDIGRLADLSAVVVDKSEYR
jgi:glycyl-tRNA synthetase beta chain